MITIENVSVTFRAEGRVTRAVQDVSLKIGQGEVFGIVGTSGAGKSTLLRTINLLEPPERGAVYIEGVDITELGRSDLRRARQKIGMVFQHFNIVHTKTVYDNVALPMRISGKTRDDIEKKVPELLEIVGLTGKAQAYPGQLSGGQKQRVGIARALANDPRLLLCDEATSALDLETTRSILELLRDINKRFGITIVLISHEMDVIKSVCTRVAVMSEGQVVEQNPVYEIFARPQHAVTRQLVKHSLNLSIPDGVLGSLSGALVRIVYRGEAALEPVLSNAIREYPVSINILHGKIEYINGQPIGILLVHLNGAPGAVRDVVDYLARTTADTEVLHV